MGRTLLAMIALGLFLWACVLMVIASIKPDFSRQGKMVLINGKDTAIITQEEHTPPSFAKRKREVTVRYKDNLGVYHETSFPENEITIIE